MPSSSSQCTDTPDAWMKENGESCDTWSWMYTNRCNAPVETNEYRASWVANKWCRYSCWKNGNGYDGDDCGTQAFYAVVLIGSVLCVCLILLPSDQYKNPVGSDRAPPAGVWAMGSAGANTLTHTDARRNADARGHAPRGHTRTNRRTSNNFQ